VVLYHRLDAEVKHIYIYPSKNSNQVE
jgi:hypothetical protein